MVQESGFDLKIHQLRGRTLGSQALPLSYYPAQPQTDPVWILLMVFNGKIKFQPRSKIQLLEKRFFNCLGDMQNLLAHSGMVSIWLLVIGLGRC